MSDPHQIYLETQIATATPQKLRLMLIEGAIRQAQLALDHGEHGREPEWLAAVGRCRSIVAELMDGIRDDGSQLVRQVIDIYAFIFSALNQAQSQRNQARLEDVLRVLQEERQTWQQICFELTAAPVAPGPRSANQYEMLAPRRVDADYSAGYSAPNRLTTNAPAISSGFSLEG